MKKFISISISLLLILSTVLCGVSVNAADYGVDNTVTYKFLLTTDSDISAFQGFVSYPADKLAIASEDDIVVYDGKTGSVVAIDRTDQPGTVLFNGSGATAVYSFDDTALVTVTFTVLDQEFDPKAITTTVQEIYDPPHVLSGNIPFGYKNVVDDTVTLSGYVDLDNEENSYVDTTETTEPATKGTQPTTESAPAYDYYMIGSKALFGADWKIDSKNGMMKIGDGNYYLFIENASAGTFYFKVMDKNNVMYPNGHGNSTLFTTTGGETVIFCFNPKKGYAVVSTDGTLPTYPTETESTEPTETTQPTTVTTAPTTEATEPTTASTAPTTEKTQPTTEPTESTAFVCNHSNIRTVGAKSATYFEKGYTGDKVCEYCGEVVAEGRSVAKKILATPKTTIKLKGGNSIVISYTKVKDAQGFEINCKIGKQTYIKKFKTTRSKTIRLINIKRGIKVTVQVRAYTTSGKKTAYSNFTKAKTFKTEELSKLSYSSIRTQKINSTTLKVTWGKVAKADGYKIKISASYKGENHTVDKKIKNNYITLTNINKDQKLSIKICPYKVVGGKTTYGSWFSKKIQ